jgi:hypothetical protein
MIRITLAISRDDISRWSAFNDSFLKTVFNFRQDDKMSTI